MPLPPCPLAPPTHPPPPQHSLCSLPLVPAEFHLPLTLDASWPLTSLPCCPHSSPFKCPAPGASPHHPPPPLHLGTHTGKTVAQAPALLTSCSISSDPDAAAPGRGLWGGVGGGEGDVRELLPEPAPPAGPFSHPSAGLSLTPALLSRSHCITPDSGPAAPEWGCLGQWHLVKALVGEGGWCSAFFL